MPLFEKSGNNLNRISTTNFSKEKELQNLVENNIDTIFNGSFIASEFSTGSLHSGRIDTLALSEDNNPIIIEYKKNESSELITQSLYYLNWIKDHKGDFEVAVKNALGNDIEVDWSNIRVICIAPNYKKYDIHAVQAIDANIELWRYRFFDNGLLYIDEILYTSNDTNQEIIEASKKVEKKQINEAYTLEEHLKNKNENIQSLMYNIRDYIQGIDSAIEEAPKKKYIAYKISQNIITVKLYKDHIKLYAKLNPSDIKNPPETYRDVTAIGHYGSGNVEFKISKEEEFEEIKPFIELAYNKIGG